MSFPSDIPHWLEVAAGAKRERKVVLSPNKINEISVTSLIAPAHQTVLLDKHWDELPPMDPVEQLPSLVGTAWHQFIAELDHPPGCMVEEQQEIYVTVDGVDWCITGTPDWYDPHDRLLVDHKTTRVWSYVFGKRDWEEQLNLYAFLLAQHGHIPLRAQIHAVYLDWSQNQFLRNPELPPRRLQVIDVELWPLKDQSNFLFSRLRKLASPELCTPDERWEKGEKWAVMKKGRKTAVKLFDNPHDAERMVMTGQDDLSVEHRPGSPVRCESWCPVKDFCEFGREL